MKLALLCVLWRYQRDVPPHRLYTDVFDINHGAWREQESHSDDTLTHPGPNSGPCSNTLINKPNMPFNLLHDTNCTSLLVL